MSFVFNIAKGRTVELYNRVKSNDPANSALIIVVLATSGLETDAVLKDKADLTALVAGSTNEVTNTNYARKTLTDSDLATFPGPDNTADVYYVDLPDQTYTSVAAGDGWSKVVVCYDADTTGGTDTNIIPLTCHDVTIVPDGNSIQLVINASGFFSAS